MHHGMGLICDIRTKINGAKGNRDEQTEIYNCINHKIRVNNDIFLIMILHTTTSHYKYLGPNYTDVCVIAF